MQLRYDFTTRSTPPAAKNPERHCNAQSGILVLAKGWEVQARSIQGVVG